MRSRAFRPIAVLLGILLLTNTPAQAGPVTIGDVLQLVGSYQNPPSLRLRGVSQTPGTHVAAGVTASSSGEIVDTSISSSTSTSLLSGIASDSQDPQKTVSVVPQGDVEISVCDCGVVTAGAGLPKWPLLFLAGIPLFFIHDKDGEEIIPNPTPTPNPNPTPTPQTPIPEPASLLLFGSGLAAVGASLRRRRMKAQLMLQSDTTEEG